MRSLAIEGCSPPIGRSQGFKGLHIKHGTDSSGCHYMETAWEPNAEELKALNAGGSVHLVLQGNLHPPVVLFAPVDNKPK